MIKSLMITLFSSIFLVSGCESTGNTPHRVVFEPTLENQSIELGEACSSTTGSRDEASEQVASCTILNRLSEYSVLATFSPEDIDLNIGDLLCIKVDLSSFAHSLRPRMNEGKNQSLNAVSNGNAISSGHSCTWSTEELNFVLDAQFGITDEQGELKQLFVILVDEQLQGSYRDYQALEFTIDQDRFIVKASE